MSQAAGIGQVVKIRCIHCNIARHYLPQDIQQIFGDVGLDRLDGAMRCAACGKREYIVAAIGIPSAAERAGMTIRRLVEIRTVRRVVWRDDPP